MRAALTLFLVAWLSRLAIAAPEMVGARIEDFTLPDCHGQPFRLGDIRDRPVIVVVFLGVDCPLAKLYAPRLAEMARRYERQGVGFIGIDSNQHDSLSALAAYGKQHRIGFPLLRDPGNAIADRFVAERTPEAFVLDSCRVIRYRGRIDDQNNVTTHRGEAVHHDLARAIDEVLAGKAVSQPVTAAPGCLISRAAKPRVDGPVTYCRDVAAILQRRCQVCHRAGEIGPFALTNYSAAVAWAAMIREVIAEGRMPPWHANPAHGRFANDPTLTGAEKDLLYRWIDGGCPEGDRRELPAAPQWAGGWNIGVPDAILEMPEPFAVPAEGVIEYQYVEVDPGAAVDRWVQAAEVRPGNRAVVHHCNVFLQPPGAPDFMEAGRLGSYCLAAMAPGTPPLALPDGMAKRIPAGWRIVLVLHYTVVGSPQSDRTRLGLKFADPKRVKKEVATKLMYDLNLAIPPGVSDHVVSQTWQIKNDVELLAFFPHMHLRGKSFRYEALHADGREEILLDVPRYDFNWQHRYVLAEPKRLPAGTRLRCAAVYDNSAANPANPDPTATVRTGTQSWEEMFNGYFDVVLADEDRTQGRPWRETLGEIHERFFRTGLVLSFVLAGALALLKARRRGSPGAGASSRVS
jgi:peroxiredoxin